MAKRWAATMGDVRDWIRRKLAGAGYASGLQPPSALTIARTSFPDVRVSCVGLDTDQIFTRGDFEAVVSADGATEFVVVVPTKIAHDAYELAEEIGICVAGFGELLHALQHDADISAHIDSQEKYERRRLRSNRHVVDVKRKGHHAYLVERQGRPPLTIATSNKYEFTTDEFLTMLESFDGLKLDVAVVTNPNCQGISADSAQAAKNAGVPVVLFSDFLANLGTKWP